MTFWCNYDCSFSFTNYILLSFNIACWWAVVRVPYLALHLRITVIMIFITVVMTVVKMSWLLLRIFMTLRQFEISKTYDILAEFLKFYDKIRFLWHFIELSFFKKNYGMTFTRKYDTLSLYLWTRDLSITSRRRCHWAGVAYRFYRFPWVLRK